MRLLCLGAFASLILLSRGEICNLKVVTDASPDYSDLPSLVHSVTAKWETPAEKCWAMFYWNHIARRQTSPMNLHGTELTDPIRQFNDYGYTMCSTISGINCGIWFNMGLAPRFWDISLHTVSEVYYDNAWHMYDNSMSALYTRCDGRTLAAVDEIGRDGACDASGGKSERGHIARYHCLYSTGPDGFLTGADTQRSLDEESRCFNPNGLKYRYYYYNWDFGHRYILNLKANESYTRHYRRLGDAAAYFVPNHGKDPDDRYRLRGNGVWVLKPDLSHFRNESHSSSNLIFVEGALHAAEAGRPGEVIFKVQGANVITSQRIQAGMYRKSDSDRAEIHLSTNNGLKWERLWAAEGVGGLKADLPIGDLVNGAYEVLVKLVLQGKESVKDAGLRDLEIETITMLNAKTQPKLNLGKNIVYVGAGDPTESIVFWPELAGQKYKEHVVEEANIVSSPKNPGYMGTLYPQKAGEDAYVVYRMDAPADLTKITYGGRFYNRAPRSHVDLFHSLDDGKTWTKTWSLTRTSPPWDVIHYETVELPKGHRSVWVKYLLNTSEAAPSGCSIYAVRMEANYAPRNAAAQPVEVTFNWSEVQEDRGLVERSHTQVVNRLPTRFEIDVGGTDHPVMNSLRLSLRSAGVQQEKGPNSKGEKFVPKWLVTGKNLAVGKGYKFSIPSGTNWGAGDPDGKKLTTGAGGPPYAGGTSYRSGAIWAQNANPVITLDLEKPERCASFGMNFHGYPWWDALQGKVQDKVEVFTSLDGERYESQGFLKTDIRWVDLPSNHMWTDEETMTGGTFRLIPAKPVVARYVRYNVTSKRMFDCTMLEVLDAIESKPFDLRLALPDEAGAIMSLAPQDDGSESFQIPGAPKMKIPK